MEGLVADSSSSSKCRFTIQVGVENDSTRGCEFLPVGFAREFGSRIGLFAIVAGPGGQTFFICCHESVNRGIMTTGWIQLVTVLGLVERKKVFLRYMGETFFACNEQDQLVDDQPLVYLDVVPMVVNPNLHKLRITSYALASNKQTLPTKVVQDHMNLDFPTMTMQAIDGRRYECPIYVSRRRITEARICKGFNGMCADLGLKDGDEVALRPICYGVNLFFIFKA